MGKYQTEAGIECTPEECKLIDSLKRLAKKWKKDGKRLLKVAFALILMALFNKRTTITR